MILISTRDSSESATFAAAMRRNMPPGGGLYMPRELPVFEDMPELLALPWPARCTELLARLLGDEYGRQELAEVVDAALDSPVPLVQVSERLYALELFHGPSLAFKDFGARFLVRMLDLDRRKRGENRGLTVLCATSGDTGAAVAHAVAQVSGVRAVVLYPEGRVSPLQERQFAGVGENVLALAVRGSFDDCQTLARACFADPELSTAGLVSANSINIARLLAQGIYYLEGVARLRALGVPEPPVVAVPSGNFGNLCAGLVAQRLGLPVKCFVVATNANTTVPEYLDTGRYRPRSSVATLSSAMDVGAPSNWERIQHLFRGDWHFLRGALRWGSSTDDEVRAMLRELQALGYIADPHTAVACGVLRRRLDSKETGVFLATAHPAKFKEVLEPTLGIKIPLPASLQAVMERPLRSESIPADLEVVKARLR